MSEAKGGGQRSPYVSYREARSTGEGRIAVQSVDVTGPYDHGPGLIDPTDYAPVNIRRIAASGRDVSIGKKWAVRRTIAV